jgi:PleD family two-component response regulator
MDATPKILVVDDDDVERMMAQETMQRDHFEGVIASKVSDGLVIVTFLTVGLLLLPIFFLVSFLPTGKRSDELPNCT